MKQPVVDYRQFRLSKLRSPEYSHLMLLAAWPVYFAAYFLTENLIPAEVCHVMWCPLDDWIPFCELFVIPYVGWYLLIAGSLLYFMLYNPKNFRRMMQYIIITQVVAVMVYILYPSRQDLRPAEFPRENLLTGLVGLLYAADTNTGVCPSLHVAYSLGIASTWMREKTVGWRTKAGILVFVILVCLSVMFIKQHSAVDLFAALPVCLLAEYLVFFRKGRKEDEAKNRR